MLWPHDKYRCHQSLSDALLELSWEVDLDLMQASSLDTSACYAFLPELWQTDM